MSAEILGFFSIELLWLNEISERDGVGGCSAGQIVGDDRLY